MFRLMVSFFALVIAMMKDPNRGFKSVIALSVWKIHRLFAVARIIVTQNRYDKSKLRNAKEVVVVLVPGDIKIHGGLMSTYNVAATARRVCPDAQVVVSTYPADVTYVHNDNFPNEESVWRWGLVLKNLHAAEKLTVIFGGPKAGTFNYDLSRHDRKVLGKVKDLRFHILNQRIDWMCNRDEYASLLALTDKIAQTTCHKRYTTQEVCDKFGVPLGFLGARTQFELFPRYSFSQKEEVVVFSPDYHEGCERVKDAIKQAFPNYRFVTIVDMKYTEYIDWVAKAKFVVTFGEGWDAYLTHPLSLGGVGFAVYNEEYFPKNHIWCQTAVNIFKSYADMEKNIVPRMKELLASQEKYEAVGKEFLKHFPQEPLEAYQSRVRRIFDRDFEFYPSPGCELKLSDAKQMPRGVFQRFKVYVDSILHPHLH